MYLACVYNSNPHLGLFPVFLELFPCPPVPHHDHLIKEKLVLVNRHLSTDRVKTSEPYIGLFSNGCVEKPSLAVLPSKFRKFLWVAVLPAEFI